MDEDRESPARRLWGRAASRDLRRRATPSERRLWQMLRDHRLEGRQFRRQHPIGPYFVEFACPGAHLVVEIDGPIHEQQREYDAERDDYLKDRGFSVIRFAADRVNRDLPAVLQEIRDACSAPPLHRNGEGVGGWG